MAAAVNKEPVIVTRTHMVNTWLLWAKFIRFTAHEKKCLAYYFYTLSDMSTTPCELVNRIERERRWEKKEVYDEMLVYQRRSWLEGERERERERKTKSHRLDFPSPRLDLLVLQDRTVNRRKHWAQPCRWGGWITIFFTLVPFHSITVNSSSKLLMKRWI